MYFDVEISYGQLAVFDQYLQQPFNNWTDKHQAQGFAWRPGSVSFGTLSSAGAALVNIVQGKKLDEKRSSGSRIITVPFTVPDHGGVEVSSISSGFTVRLSPGSYELTFEHGSNPDGVMWVNLIFGETSIAVTPRVIRADAQLSPPQMLLMDAQPA